MASSPHKGQVGPRRPHGAPRQQLAPAPASINAPLALARGETDEGD